MNIAHELARIVHGPYQPPAAGGWRNELPEAFGALDASGDVSVIGYLGEWYVPIKPTIRVRLHNWLINVGDRCPAEVERALAVERRNRQIADGTVDEIREELTQSEAAVEELCEAIRLTVEYVGTGVLHPGEGWSWYDALQKHRPDILRPILTRHADS